VNICLVCVLLMNLGSLGINNLIMNSLNKVLIDFSRNTFKKRT